ncbi:probable arabinosyltransferase ARAD1 [Macadamia integrifolia]|uniref:probable arabinosyltransferase ARAD1 n=1 Tax=Macadamia integrifolia TaxID=60698 RepID=UPI001C4ED726|nr:probable arabinosyltransferase ARAD1 [Macadamia integrifolia]XP_042488685.1 probable arabinosyltransferase ARAD1 [Macadamia integrifolia]
MPSPVFMSEKRMQPSRLLFCLITSSMFLLMLSFVFLFQSDSSSLIPESVFKLILLNNTSEFYSPSSDSEIDDKLPTSLPLLSPTISDKPRSGDLDNGCQGPNSNNETGDLVQGTNKVCDATQALLRVFMYDLPPEFHFGLLGWKGKVGQIWPDVSDPNRIPSYPGGLNLQHSIEYWLTLDLLSSNIPSVIRPCSAVRVVNSSQADIIFVPFFSSLSYNRNSKLHGREKASINRMLQDKLVQFLMSQDEWKRSGGKDHLIVAHHPNSMMAARRKLGSAILVLADFGRYPVEIANIDKDIIAPYKHVVRTIYGESVPFEKRPILVYFQGAIYRKDGGVIRQELYYLLKDEKDVHFTFGNVRSHGISKAGQGMASSRFCLNIAGDTPSSNRLFDAIASHCVPVIISDKIELPFEDVLDYAEFCIFVRASDAVKKGFLLNLLRGIKKDRWTTMWEKLKQVAHHFEYQYPSQPGDSVAMIWEAVSRKRASIRFRVNKNNRFSRSQLIRKHK